jgi:predicted transcriptional regulator
MTTSMLDRLLTEIFVESYKENQPILQTVIERDPLLSLLMKIYKGNLSERDINLHKYLLSYLAKRKLLIREREYDKDKYYLTDIGKEIIKKIEYELKLLKNINKEDLNINIDDLLRYTCKNMPKIKKSSLHHYPLFYTIYLYYDRQEPFTPYFIGRVGIILIYLYREDKYCKKCKNWWSSPKKMKEFLFKIPQCHYNFGDKLDISLLVELGLVNREKGRGHTSRYRLSKEGYYVTQFILKNLSIVVYKYL